MKYCLTTLLMAAAVYLNAQQQQSGFCYTMQVALASGQINFQPFKGVMDKDTFNYAVKEEILQGGTFTKGSITIEPAGYRFSKVLDKKFRLNTMVFNTTVIGYKANGIADTIIDDATYKRFDDFTKALAAQCFENYKLIEGPKRPRSGTFGTYYLAPAEIPMDGDYIDFNRVVDMPFIQLRLQGFFTKAITIEVTFYYPTSK